MNLSDTARPIIQHNLGKSQTLIIHVAVVAVSSTISNIIQMRNHRRKSQEVPTICFIKLSKPDLSSVLVRPSYYFGLV